MRIGIQILSLRPGLIGGQGVFVRRLLSHLPPLLEEDRLVVFLRPELAAESVMQTLANDPRVEFVVETPERHYGDGYADWNLGRLDAARLDTVFFPLSFFFPRPLPLPVAVHVPDLQYECLPDNFSPEQLAWRRERIPESVRLADAVITFTRFSADTLEDRLGADPSRLHVIPAGGFTAADLNGADAATSPTLPPEVLSAGYVLYPAADWPHKNHETLIEAMAMLSAAERPEHLVLTGMLTQREEQLRAHADRHSVAGRVHFLGSVAQAELIALYRYAAALAFPSRYEGFGLPLVEAMQLDCPIVASDAAGVAETVGPAAVLCDDDPVAWADKLGGVLADAALRKRLVRRGRARAGWFDWRRCAVAHLAVLRGMVSDGRGRGATVRSGALPSVR